MEKNKKRPSTTAKDKNEKILGQWISHQIQNREKPIFGPTFYVLHIYQKNTLIGIQDLGSKSGIEN